MTDWRFIFQEMMPIISAQYFIVLLIYFTSVRHRIGRVFPYYACVLTALIVFLGGKSLGHIHLGLSVESLLYLRCSVLYALGMPAWVIAAVLQTGRSVSRGGRIALFAAGAVYAAAYVIVRDLTSTVALGKGWGITWRQVEAVGLTIRHAHLIQMVGTLVLLVLPVLYLLLARSKRARKPVAFLGGTLSFGLCLVCGAALEQWWIYYSGSIFSALFWGAAVLRELKHMRAKVDNLAPLINEELLENISAPATDSARLTTLFEALDLVAPPNRFLVIRPDAAGPGFETGLLMERLDGLLRAAVGEGEYLLIPSGSVQLGLCVAGAAGRADSNALDLAEKIREYAELNLRGTVCVGIGGCYDEIGALRFSYQQAFAAVQHAARAGANMVMTHADLHPAELDGAYPYRKREELIHRVRTNHTGLLEDSVAGLVDELHRFSGGSLPRCKRRVREVLFMLFDAAGSEGEDSAPLLRKLEELYGQIDRCATLPEISTMLAAESMNLAQQIRKIPENRVDQSVERARMFIAQNYEQDIGVDAVAAALSVSRSYLTSMFKKGTGTTVNQYLTNVRIEHAKILLLSKSVTETAFAVGFNTSSYFSTVFKKETGLTPKQFQASVK